MFFNLIKIKATACFLSILYLNDWERHYIVRSLRLLNNPQDGPWRELAMQINIEVRRPLLYSMTNLGI